MPRRPSVPSYRHHRPSGQAVVTVRGQDGSRRDVYLGPYNSPESRKEYARIVAELAAAGDSPTPSSASDLSVNEILLAYLRHAQQHFRDPDGAPTSELRNMKEAMGPVRTLYAHTQARGFGPLALKAVRQRLVDAGNCRTLVNARVNRVRRVFKWAASEELIPSEVYHRLTTVQGPARGRTAVRETEPVEPLDEIHVTATLPHLNRHVDALVRLQVLAGMRPGEAVRMRAADIDPSGPVWVYRLDAHKTAYRGKSRSVQLGPQSQELIRGFLTADPAAYLFSPAAATTERHGAMRAARKSKVQPSQAARGKAHPKRAPGER